MNNMNKFITIQVGARRKYAIPSILEDAGMLEALYTDICADVGLGQWLDAYCPKPLRAQSSIQRLLNRKLPSTIERKTTTFEHSAIEYLIFQKLAGNDIKKQHSALVSFSHKFGRQLVKRGLGKATHVFSMFGEGAELLEEAKRQNLKTITEIYISPATHRIVQEERSLYPELEAVLSEEIVRRDYATFAEICRLTDIFLVPSKFVQEGLAEFGIGEDRCRLVPYAVDDTWFEIKRNPVVGRILFVGTAEIRKGIHILAQAAQKLAPLGYEFRVAGGVSDTIRNHPTMQHLNFLGRVPRADIQKEYARADIFVLPSLAEGSAEVTYEALASALPVITTKAAGSVVRHSVDGFIVPESSPTELAQAIESIVEDRTLRHEMSCSARQRAKDYTWKKYEERLLEICLAV